MSETRDEMIERSAAMEQAMNHVCSGEPVNAVFNTLCAMLAKTAAEYDLSDELVTGALKKFLAYAREKLANHGAPKRD